MRHYSSAICLLLILLFSGCCGNNDLLLDKNIFEWAPYITAEEIILQTPDNQKYITFNTEVKSDNQTATDKVCGDYEVETKKVFLQNTENQNLQIQVILSHEAVIALKVISAHPAAQGLNIQFNTISEKFISDEYRDKFFKSISLNGKSFQNVLLLHGSVLPNNSGFSEIYYGKEVGLIALRTFSGEWYYKK